MMRRKYPPKTIFSKHNVDTLRKFCKLGLRVEGLLENEMERIKKEIEKEPDKKESGLELISRHRDAVKHISDARLHFATMMPDKNLHE